MSSCGARVASQWDSLAVVNQNREADSALLFQYPFLNLLSDTIIDPTGSMDSFRSTLELLGGPQVDSLAVHCSVVHYGDSHIQAGHLSETVMHRLQNQYGNAGRGTIVPYRLMSSNEPRDYSIRSNTIFERASIIERSPCCPPGVTGITLKGPRAGYFFTLRSFVVPEYPNQDYRFNRVVVLHDSLAPMVTAKEELLDTEAFSDIYNCYSTSIDLKEASDSLELYTYAKGDLSTGGIYGFSLENGHSGVLYHSLGVNSACYLHWGAYPEIATQSVALQANLIIVSLGTNEAAGGNFIDEVFYNEIDSFISGLRRANPTVPILLTTPVENMRSKRRSREVNRNIARVAQTIKDYGQDHGIAVLDLFEACGGSGSVVKWNEASMMQRDKIHFTPQGYNIQGLLIYYALISRNGAGVFLHQKP
ncbi:MAG: GDSL-type esterase/lipase family protein [Mucinivorans sp.]